MRRSEAVDRISGRAHRLGGVLFALALATGCHSAEEEKPPAPVPVEAARVQPHDVAEVLLVSGTLEAPPGRDVRLGGLVAGRVTRIAVVVGQRVTAGELLAQIDAVPSRGQVAQARAALVSAKAAEQNAQARLERARRLFTAGVVARQEVEDAKAQLAEAQAQRARAEAELSTAQNQLGRPELRAPFDGVVAQLFVAPGEPIDGSGKPVVEVVDPSALELVAPLGPAEAARVHPGAPAQVEPDGVDHPLAGQVVAVSPVVESATGMMTVRVRLENPGGVPQGASARAELQVALHRGVLAVPRAALVPRVQGGQATAAAEATEGGPIAVEVIAHGKAERRPIELGAINAQWAEVRRGLSPGEQVVVQGAYALPDGTPLEVVQPDAGSGEAR